MARGHQVQIQGVAERKVVVRELGKPVGIPGAARADKIDAVAGVGDHHARMLERNLVLMAGFERPGGDHQERLVRVAADQSRPQGVRLENLRLLPGNARLGDAHLGGDFELQRLGGGLSRNQGGLRCRLQPQIRVHSGVNPKLAHHEILGRERPCPVAERPRLKPGPEVEVCAVVAGHHLANADLPGGGIVQKIEVAQPLAGQGAIEEAAGRARVDDQVLQNVDLETQGEVADDGIPARYEASSVLRFPAQAAMETHEPDELGIRAVGENEGRGLEMLVQIGGRGER